MRNQYIGRVAADLGIKPRTLRYYENVGLLPKPSRTPSGYRVYDSGKPPCPLFGGFLRTMFRRVDTQIQRLRSLKSGLRNRWHVGLIGAKRMGMVSVQGWNFTSRRIRRDALWGRLTMAKVVPLCPACSNCPTVELRDNEVYIGEGDNVVSLGVDEWNVLVRAVKAGTLDEVKPQSK